jgi:hypothetical protein
MEPAYADIELLNGVDLVDVRRHMIDEERVRRVRLNILVDTNFHMLAISEPIRQQLQLPVVEKRNLQTSRGGY